jgi:hypothetical protein
MTAIIILSVLALLLAHTAASIIGSITERD